MFDPAEIVRDRLTKAEAKLRRLRSQVDTTEKEVNDLQITLRVLTDVGVIEESNINRNAVGVGASTSKAQVTVLAAVPRGEANALAPKDIHNYLAESGNGMDADYVRTVLWRAARKGTIQNTNGLYWTPMDFNSENRKAPDAPTPRASENLGPVTGRESGYPPDAPEGSIPSGSTPSKTRHPAWDADLDDDVPF